jgi:hypothetical protein
VAEVVLQILIETRVPLPAVAVGLFTGVLTVIVVSLATRARL